MKPHHAFNNPLGACERRTANTKWRINGMGSPQALRRVPKARTGWQMHAHPSCARMHAAPCDTRSTAHPNSFLEAAGSVAQGFEASACTK